MLTISFKRVSQTHHEISYKRDDGTGEAASVETKSLLMHDFIHYCLESEAHLSGGFYGLISSGLTYAELSGKMPAEFDRGEVADVEQVVGPLTSVIKGQMTPAQFMDQFAVVMSSLGRSIPSWLSLELVERVVSRYRSVMGKWNDTPFGGVMQLAFTAE